MKIRPVDLPELRADTVRSVTKTGTYVYERSIAAGKQFTLPKAATPAQAATALALMEVDRLRRADLFYVTADMTELAVAAGSSLPEFTLMPDDVPAPNGFIYFDTPIAVADYEDDDGHPAGRSPIVAAAWSTWTGGIQSWTQGGIWVTWYADARGLLDNAATLGLIEQRAADQIRHTLPRLAIDNETQSPFSSEPIGFMKSSGEPLQAFEETTGGARWLATLKATWLLMMQPVTTVTDAQFDRAARRRLPKGQEPDRVRVITLRRAAGGGSGETGREHHHQWIVRGHWRQQWYPARQVHRPVWIAPHVKGPEGAPMLGGEKVYAWTR